MGRSLLALLVLTALPAQTKDAPKEAPSREAELDQKIVPLLVAFARSAETWKAPSRARAVYVQILEYYDTDNATARVGLGYQRMKGEWKQNTPAAKLPADTATAAQIRSVDEAWKIASKRVARLHRELGLALLAEGLEPRGRYQLERVLAFDGDDVEAHRALGHEEIDGFFGTAEDVAFVRRMREIAAKAREIANQAFQVTELPAESMPSELRQSGLPFRGARSKHFAHWVVDSAEAAIESVIWAERANALLDFLLPAATKTRLQPRAMEWYARLRTTVERDTLFAASPSVLGKYDVTKAKMFGGLNFKTATGWAEFHRGEVENDADSSVAHVTKRCCVGRGNPGLGEGLVHAMTWLLCGSTHTYYCDLPATVTDGTKLLARDPDEWLERLQSEIAAGKDWPLVQVPRERYDNFHESARIKTWSFVLWLVARYPGRWPRLLDAVTKQNQLPEDVAAAFREVLERDVGEIEAEWREWARAGSRIGKAAGLGR